MQKIKEKTDVSDAEIEEKILGNFIFGIFFKKKCFLKNAKNSSGLEPQRKT